LGGRSVGIGTIVVAGGGGSCLASTDDDGYRRTQRWRLDSPGQQQGQLQRHSSGRPLCLLFLADTEDVWKDVFSRLAAPPGAPRLVLIQGRVGGAAALVESAMGPFMPADQKVYIDLNFYETLTQRLGAPGDFAQPTLVAHEVGFPTCTCKT
jgi:predicted metalloprotease